MARLSWIITCFFVIFVMDTAIGALNSHGDQISSGVIFRPTGGEGSLRSEECPAACLYRCSETSHKKPCMLYCNQCCEKCLCVPSGTYGHKEECPCYNNWKTQEGRPKCP